MREALLFYFNLKKSVAESHRMLVEAYGDNALSKTMSRDWFRRSILTTILPTILTSVTRSMKIGPGRLRTVNCKLFWTRTIPDRKKCLPIGCFSSSHFHATTCHGEDSKDRKMSVAWIELIGRWSDTKIHAKFCLPDKKESRCCIGLWQAMKSGSIFRILNARNLGLIPPNHQHLPQDQSLRMEDDTVHLVGSGGCHLLRAVKTWWNY